MNDRDRQHANSRSRPAGRAAVALAAGMMLLAPAVSASPQSPPSGFTPEPGRQSLQALDDPDFVAASNATMRPEAWVLGVEHDGNARAYGLELLNDHEVVNDRLGDMDIAVVWSPLANAAVVLEREIGGRTLHFDPAPGLLHAATVLQDRETGSYWPILAGRAESGELAGTALTVLPIGDRMSWAEWSARHPDTAVLTVGAGGDGRTPSYQDPGVERYQAYFAASGPYRGVVVSDRRLPAKQLVYALQRDGVAYAVDLRRVIGGKSFTLQDGSHILVHREATDGYGHGSSAFVSRAGFEQRGGSWFELATQTEFNAITRDFGAAGVSRLNGFDTFWYTWTLHHPGTELLR